MKPFLYFENERNRLSKEQKSKMKILLCNPTFVSLPLYFSWTINVKYFNISYKFNYKLRIFFYLILYLSVKPLLLPKSFNSLSSYYIKFVWFDSRVGLEILFCDKAWHSLYLLIIFVDFTISIFIVNLVLFNWVIAWYWYLWRGCFEI